jgi:hypothetical protein
MRNDIIYGFTHLHRGIKKEIYTYETNFHIYNNSGNNSVKDVYESFHGQVKRCVFEMKNR